MKSYKKIFLPIVWMLFVLAHCPVIHGQTTINGKVLDDTNEPLAFANILLLKANDSTLTKGVITEEDGTFLLEDILEGQYKITASMMGFGTKTTEPFVVKKGGSINFPTMVLTEGLALGEVVVVEKRPFVEQKIDRMVVNVANSIIASGSTALEVLEKAPGVTVDRQNDMLQLRGKSGVIVEIDGKQTYLPMPEVVAMLRSMSSDNIDQIELITNPSAKYDAAGNSGIINIRLKKNNNIGTNGSISLGGGAGRFERERGSIQLNHRAKTFNLFGNYSANRGGNYFDLQTAQNRDSSGVTTFTRQDTYIRFKDWDQNMKVGVDYFLGKNTTLGAAWTGFWGNNQERGTAESAFRRELSGPNFLLANTDKTISNLSSNHIFNVNFQHTFKAQDQLSIDVDRGFYQREFSNTLLTRTIIPENDDDPLAGLFLNMPTDIDITTFKIDYDRTFGNGWKMETGLKSAKVHNDNDLMLSRGVDEVIPDPSLSNHFLYTERVNAAYASAGGKLNDKMDVQLGLRAEQTRSEGNSITTNTVVKRDYLDLFPSFFISRQLQKDNSLTFSYSYRIDRPDYQSLNPGRSYVDPYLYSRGNAFLKPQYTHSLELKHGFKEKIFTSLSASFISDLVFFVIQPVDSLLTERTPLNIGSSKAYSLTTTFPVTVMKGWNLQTTLLANYSRFQYTYKDIPLRVEQFSGQLNASNTFVFGKSWTGELAGWLKTPGVEALFHSFWLGTMDMGIQKEIGTKLKAKLSVQDIFHTNRIRGETIAPGFRSAVDLSFDTRVAMLILTYNFGNQQLKAIRQRKTGSEEERQRTN